MKKIFRYIIAGLAAVMAASCVEEESFIQVDTDKFLAPVLNDFTPVVTELTEAEAANTYATVQFTAADYGVASSTNYTLYASIAGTDFAKEKQVGMPVTSPKTEIKVSVLDVNKVLISLNCTPGVEVDLDFRVKAEWMGEKLPVDGSALYSNAVQASAVPYNMEKTYDPVWVIGDYCGWAHDKTLFLWNYKEDKNVYSGLIDFGKADADGNIVSAAKNGWKITGVAGWDDTCNWGLETEMKYSDEEPAKLQLFNGGGSKDIKVYAKRFYGFTLDKTTLELTKDVAFNQMGIIGLNGDWNNDIVMEYSKLKQRFYADVEVPAETTFKFRADGKWDYNLGGDLDKLTSGGDNITISAGNYRIYLDMNNPEAYVATINADAYGTEEGSAPVTPEPEPEQPSGNTVKMYFVPTAAWMGEGVTFAAWAWVTGEDGAWFNMTESATDGVYEVEIPEECDNIIFTSMEGENDWNNKKQQTENLTVPTDGKNAYDLASGTWIEYVAPNVTVYFKPKSTWAGEGVTFAAWIWATGGDGSWYSLTDSDEDGIYEVTFPKELDNIIFTSMKGANDWGNKQQQTGDLKVPTDEKNTYDGETETWVEFGTVTVYFKPKSAWTGEGVTFAAWIWATGGDGSWYSLTDSDEDGIYEVSFPGELDNIIFTSMKGANDWGNKQQQTGDLKVPTDGKNAYDGGTETWMTLDEAKGSEEPETPEVVAPVVEENAIEADVTVLEEDSIYGIIGVTGWGESDDIIMKKTSDEKVFVAKGVQVKSSFKVRKAGSWDDAANFGLESYETALEANKGYVVITSGVSKDMKVAEGTYDIWFHLEKMHVYIMEAGKHASEAE